MQRTKIEWTDTVWNPITGCTPISKGCRNCYAKRMSTRLVGRYGYPKDDPFRVTFHPNRLEEPMRCKKPKRIFVCSMGDLFHEHVLDKWLHRIWEVMASCPQRTFFVLTKRPQNTKFIGNALPNLWFGVSVEDQKTADERIPILLQIPAAHRWVSIEPCLGPVDIEPYFPRTICDGCGKEMSVGRIHEILNNIEDRFPEKCGTGIETEGLDWVVLGGETGPHARPLHPDWVRLLRDQCQAAGVPFFFKSWGEWKPYWPNEEKPTGKWREWNGGIVSVRVGHKLSGCKIDGREWKEILE